MTATLYCELFPQGFMFTLNKLCTSNSVFISRNIRDYRNPEMVVRGSTGFWPNYSQFFPLGLNYTQNKLRISKSRRNTIFRCRSHSEQKVMSGEYSVIRYTKLMHRAVDGGRFGQAIKLFDEMLSKGIEPDMYTFNVIMKGMCLEGSENDAFELVKGLKTRGYMPNMVSYNILLRAFLELGKWKDGEEVVMEMFSTDCEPDVVTYITMITNFCLKGQADEAINLLKIMTTSGCSPTMLTVLWKTGDKKRVVRLVSDMLDIGIDPDEITYSALISCLCRDGMVDSALELLEYMKNSGISPSEITYGTILRRLCSLHRSYDAIAMLEEMIKSGYRPKQTTYYAIIIGIGKEGLTDEAMELANILYKKKIISLNLKTAIFKKLS